MDRQSPTTTVSPLPTPTAPGGPGPVPGGGDLSRLDAALGYAAVGWQVFPVDDVGKKPLTPRGYLDATLDGDQIRSWWTKCPTARVGVALRPSGLIAVDVDVSDGKPGLETIERLQQQHGRLPWTNLQISGRGGKHFVMRDPSPGSEGWTRTHESGGCARGTLGPGVDLKINGYIVVEPSGTYRWEQLNPDNVAAVPSAWIPLMRKSDAPTDLDAEGIEAWQTSTETLGALDTGRLTEMLAECGRGQGENATLRAIRMCCHDFGMSVEDAAPFLEAWNARCGKPHTAHELRRQIERCARVPDDSERERGWMVGLSSWLANLRVTAANANARATIGESSADAPPPSAPSVTATFLEAALKDARDTLARRKGPHNKVDAEYLRQILKVELITDMEEFTHAAIAVARHAPRNATDDQLIRVLLPSAGAFASELPEVVRWARLAEVKLREDAKRERESELPLDEFVPAGGPPNGKFHNICVGLRRLGVTLSYDLLAEREYALREGRRSVVEDWHVDDWHTDFETDFRVEPEFGYFGRKVTTIARRNAFHPIRDYLDGLPAWDGVPRVERWLIAAGAPDTEYVQVVSRLVLVAAVRRIRRPGCKFDEMLVLESPQGRGKSSALAALCPERSWFTDDFKFGDETKKMMEMIEGRWIVEAGELKGMTAADHADVKQMLSRGVDTARMSYARRPSNRDRQCIFIGTTNDCSYLRDPTGDRRYWPVAIVEFDVAALLADRDQMWAEASYLERTNSADDYIRLAPELYDAAAAEQEKRRTLTAIEVRLAPFDGVAGKVRVEDVWQMAGFVDVDPSDAQISRINITMVQWGWSESRRRADGTRCPCYVRGTDVEQARLINVVPSTNGLRLSFPPAA